MTLFGTGENVLEYKWLVKDCLKPETILSIRCSVVGDYIPIGLMARFVR